ncbi:hypothetical protein OSB04_un001002 [Centaurea solstitialis]|uniref:Reverse transcriptase zinc-binding domain-containing protein n=1 Tax=Centaurea solstitialis TaxID=347529 RepID=A0AA38S4U6_9ASTR|nr:hypothetical protein OSB04_un001002 [Centaurea solstitialis]
MKRDSRLSHGFKEAAVPWGYSAMRECKGALLPVKLASSVPRACRGDNFGSKGVGSASSLAYSFVQGRWVDNRWTWDWRWRREPRGREVGELRELERKLSGWEPVRDKRDGWDWSFDVGKGFSVKRCREVIVEGRGAQASGSGETLWCRIVPKKVNIFMWRARIGRLPSREALNDKGIDLDSILCPRCGEEVENLDHALLNCNLVKDLWLRIGRWWNKNLEGIGSLQQLLHEDLTTLKTSKGKSRWVAVKWSVLYLLWHNRNKVVFKNSSPVMRESFFIWQRQIFEWICSKSKHHGDWFEWVATHADSASV